MYAYWIGCVVDESYVYGVNIISCIKLNAFLLNVSFIYLPFAPPLLIYIEEAVSCEIIIIYCAKTVHIFIFHCLYLIHFMVFNNETKLYMLPNSISPGGKMFNFDTGW